MPSLENVINWLPELSDVWKCLDENNSNTLALNMLNGIIWDILWGTMVTDKIPVLQTDRSSLDGKALLNLAMLHWNKWNLIDLW